MIRPVLSCCAILAAASFANVAGAANSGSISVTHAWIRTPPSGAATAAGYVTVVNRGTIADALLGGATPAAGAVEPHTMSMAGGVMRMRLASGGFPIAPGATLTLSPGGDHLMLTGLKRPLKSGEHIAATLRFARAGSVKVDFQVQSGPGVAPGSMAGMKMN